MSRERPGTYAGLGGSSKGRETEMMFPSSIEWNQSKTSGGRWRGGGGGGGERVAGWVDKMDWKKISMKEEMSRAVGQR